MSLPKQLQAILWSKDINHIDQKKDKEYIIHQIFAFGRIEDIIWLFKTYSSRELTKIFTSIPYKDYTAARFHFVKNYLLGLKNRNLNERLYVKNTPRDIR